MANPKNAPTVEINWEAFSPDSPDYMKIKTQVLDHARNESDSKNLKIEVLAWMKNNDPGKMESLDVLEDWRFKVVGLYYFAQNRGAEFDASTKEWLEQKIGEMVEVGSEQVAAIRKVEARPKPRPIDPQVRDHRLGQSLAADLEDLILDGWRNEVSDFNTIVLRESVTPKILQNALIRFQDFVDEMLSFKDDEIEEGFTSRKAYESSRDAYVEMGTLLRNFVENSRTRRKGAAQRNGKVSSAERKVVRATEKVNYRKEDRELGLVSIDPSQIVGAKAILIYNTKDRKLGMYHAKDDSGLNVKGTTIQNYDEVRSTQKTLRNPKDQIQSFQKVQLRRAELVFADYIKAKANGMTGRINAHVVILAAWK
jgi:hypothetical protein